VNQSFHEKIRQNDVVKTRWVLAAGGIAFENVCLSTHKEFTDLRDVEEKLLFGQMPLLEIDGLELVQSQAMVRYVAAKTGLAGKTPAEVALVDMTAEFIRDARGKLVGLAFSDDQEAHKASVR
jgi:glutathione S-transferase